MKKNTNILGILLIGLSIALHLLHFAVFKDLHHILIFLLTDIAFIPLEVFFVSLVLDKFIEKREHRQLMKKVNMLIGLFYQEMGNQLLSVLALSDENMSIQDAIVDFEWDSEKYCQLRNNTKNYNYKIDIFAMNLEGINALIANQQQLITNLITNSALQEHELFTEVLMSIFHLSEELRQRPLNDLEEQDYNHLKVDIERVYRNLSFVWVDYMEFLQKEYPYLFLSAITNNPFDSRGRMDIEKSVLGIT